MPSLRLLVIIVTDNSPCFAISEFADFVKANGIQHIKKYHPATNSLTESAIQMFKASMKKFSLQDHINSFLFKYCIIPQITTGVTPAELLIGCKLCSHLDLLVEKE